MDRGVANSFNGPQVPYYHNDYNHNNHHHHHHHVASVGYHPYGQNEDRDQRFNQQYYDHYPGHQNMTGDHNGSFHGGGYGPHGGVRKRRSEFAMGVSPDSMEGGNTKLYVAPVPRTASEEEVHKVFREHGNVTEIILPRDKRNGERTGYCFVKYKALVEADRAIAALQDQYTFPGEVAPIKVRFADGERERIVQIPDKLYVGCLSKLTTKPEIHEIFSSYGVIEDIYMAVDVQKQSRGYAFVQFSRREMALAAIQGLNGIFTMRGSEQPLIVKFADPKKPRLGEPRSTPNVPPPMHQSDPHWHPQGFPQWGNKEPGGPRPTLQMPQHSAQAPSEVHKQMQPNSSSQNSEVARIETRGEAQMVASNSSNDLKTSSTECDWSEHFCPDGYKYYYNCVTCESTWEMPVEFAVFEKWLQEQTELKDLKLQSHSSNCQNEETVTNRGEQTAAHLSQQSTGPEQSDAHLLKQSFGPAQIDVHLVPQTVGPEQTDAHLLQQTGRPEKTDALLSHLSVGSEQNDAHLSQQNVGLQQTDAHLPRQSAGQEQVDAHLLQPSTGPKQTDADLSQESIELEQINDHISQQCTEFKQTDGHLSQERFETQLTDAHLLQRSTLMDQTVSHIPQESTGLQSDIHLSQENIGLDQINDHIIQQSAGTKQTDARPLQQSVGLKQNDAHLSQPNSGPELSDVHLSSTEPEQTDSQQATVGLEQTDARLSQQRTESEPQKTDTQQLSVGLLQTDAHLLQPSMSTQDQENNLDQPVTSLTVGATCS